MNETFLYTPNKFKCSDFNMWMAFPGIYSFAMSSLGYLWLFRAIDKLEDVNVERVCSDTAKTKYMVKDVSLIGFSFSFDLDFLNIFKMLDKYKIPLKSANRDESHPMVFGGGPVLTANPAPFLAFFDYIVVGDGEIANIMAVEVCKSMKGSSKSEILAKLATVDGIYVPGYSDFKVVKEHCLLEECIATPILSEKSFFKNTYIIEIARGCSNRCGFCLASYLNLPTRFIDFEKIISAIDLGLEHTDKIALLGALISAHPDFDKICKYINDKKVELPELELSVSSLRADSIEPDVVKTLVNCGQKHSTIAIEAGSDRLRKVINKNLTEAQIFDTVRVASENGLKGLKIYAMIGLPTETQDDLQEMIDLVRKIKKQFKGFELTFGFSSFVPKPHTPFQWCGRESIKSIESKQNFLKKEFHKLGVKARFSSAKWDYWQAVISRGDEKLSDFILKVYELGGNIGAFKTAYKDISMELGLFDSEYYAQREIDLDEVLPWDFIELAPGKEFLKREHDRLLKSSI